MPKNLTEKGMGIPSRVRCGSASFPEEPDRGGAEQILAGGW